MRFVIFSILLAVVMHSFACADTLDFENLNLQTNDLIPQSFGDTSEVDVTYRGELFSSQNIFSENLTFSADDYGDIQNVVFTPHFDGGTTFGGAIVLFGLDNHQVTLESFEVDGREDVNMWMGWGSFRVYDGDYNLLYEELQVDIEPGSSPVTISPNVTADELILKWTAIDGSRFIGLDNIEFNTQPIPEPSCLFVLAAALLALPRRPRI